MPIEILDVVEDVNWVRRPKTKKRSTFLDRQKEILCLPAPAEHSQERIHSHKAEVSMAKEREGQIIKRGADEHRIESTHKDNSSLSKESGDSKQIPGRKPFTITFNPVTIIGYIHVVINAVIMLAFLYLSLNMVYFLTVDVIYRIGAKREEARAEMVKAAHSYAINKCDPTTRVPALELQCGEWDRVARNGLSGIKYTKLVIEMLADLADGFIDRISLKSSIVLGSLLLLVLLFRR